LREEKNLFSRIGSHGWGLLWVYRWRFRLFDFESFSPFPFKLKLIRKSKALFCSAALPFDCPDANTYTTNIDSDK
jgi:hypothetical protein